VPEQLLDRAQVDVGVQQVGRVAVAQRVRARVSADARAEQPLSQQGADAPVREAAAAPVQEERLRQDAGPPARLQVGDERGVRLGRNRDHALLVSLAAHLQLAAVGIEVAHVEPHQLAHAQAGAVEQVEQRAVAPLERGAALRIFELDQAIAVLRGERRGEPPLRLGSGQALGGIALHVAGPLAEPVEGPQGGQAPVARRGAVHAVEAGQVGAQGEGIQAVEATTAPALLAPGQPRHLRGVGAQRVR
jgi:hypothetical protein